MSSIASVSSSSTEDTHKSSTKMNNNFHQCKIITQRANSASLLLDNEKLWAKLKRCLIVSISFTNIATPDILPKVVKGILNMPVLTSGEWGDGTKPVSLATLIEGQNSKEWGLMIIPAAALNCKLKGKYIQYRDQCEKKYSEMLYNKFKEMLKEALIHAKTKCNGASKVRKKKTTPQGALASTPPNEMFQKAPFEQQYKNFDEKGMPSHDINDEPLTKSMKKKLNKLYNRQLKRHAKYLNNPDAFKDELNNVNNMLAKEKLQSNENNQNSIDEKLLPIQLVCGTFGNRQGLKLDAECGPFSHVVEF